MSGTQGRYETEKSGSNGAESKPRRHNFLMPSDLNWGRQKSLPFKLITCPPPNARKSVPACHIPSPVRITDNFSDGRRSKSPVTNTPRTPSRRLKSINSQVDDVSEKLSDGVKLPVSEEKKKKKKEKKKEVEDESLPWSLRTRRSNNNVGGGSGFSPLKGLAALAANEKGEASSDRMPPPRHPSMPKFSPTLTKQEIEEDLWAMTGGKPPKKPKKRSRAVQKHINALAPGQYLPDVSLDSYAVSDTDKF